jgi:sugar O-acyltransferase (sialic acid O-acetyltransferase NeuD family)
MNPIIVIGAGGHASVVADALLACGVKVLGYTDNDSSIHGRLLHGIPILGSDEILEKHRRESVLLANGIGGTGTTSLRRTVQERLESAGWRFAPVRHPSAVVSTFAQVDGTAQIFAGAIVQAGAHIHRGCLINTGAIVEHDVVLHPFVHVAPGAVLCGAVSVGAESHIGAGAVVRQLVRLGEHTMIGAGAVVVDDFRGAGTLLGVPACLAKQ